jgi:hypothetical protein
MLGPFMVVRFKDVIQVAARATWLTCKAAMPLA